MGVRDDRLGRIFGLQTDAIEINIKKEPEDIINPDRLAKIHDYKHDPIDEE